MANTPQIWCLFYKEEIGNQTLPISTICLFFRVDPDSVRKNDKRHWSIYRTWEKREHATEHLVYTDNISESIAIDELTLLKGELYTYISSKDKNQRNGTLTASIQGTKAEDIIRWASRFRKKSDSKSKG